MIPGWVFPSLLPPSTLPDADSHATVSVETLLLADPDADLIFLLEVTPSGGVMLRLSDVGYITTSTDSPASTPYRDRLLTPYNVETRIPAPDEGGAFGDLAFGVIELESGDEALNTLLSQSWEGRQVTVKVGGRYHVGRVTEGSLTFAQFQIVQRATVASVGWSDGRIILSLRELLQKLSLPLQQNTYLGTGGLEGGEAVKGQRKPLAYGSVKNWEPLLIDAANQIYQWSDGQVDGVDAVRDKGVALTNAGNVSDIVAASPPAGGTFITQNSGGYIRLGGLPDGRITLDGRGDKTGGVYITDTPSIVQRMALRVGLVSSDFEAGTFGGFPTVGPVGIGFRDDPISALDAISQLMAGVFGWVSQTRTGLLRIGKYADPAVMTPGATIMDDTLEAIEDETVRAPVWRVEVAYARNWTEQDPDGLSDALTVAERELYSQPYKLAEDEDASLKTTHPDARVIRIESYFANATDADALATEALAVLQRRARVYRARVERQMFQRQPGSAVRVESADSDLVSGRNLLVLSVAEDASERINEWELWG